MHLPPHEQLQAVVRGLTTTTRDGQELALLTAERHFPADRNEVWDALTNPERVPRWMAPVSGDLRVGGRYQIEGNAGGEILVCTPPDALSLTWEFGGMVSWVDVTLTSDGDRTRLVLEHTAPVDPDKWAEFGPGAVGIGWEMALMGIDEHLFSPDTQPADTQAWMASPEGWDYLVEFITASSDAWTEASISFGTDPEAARAAGQRCTEAYTARPEG
jgi:uncharacterized protein YndB with AHSA1/START domain